MHRHLEDLKSNRHVDNVTEVVYEPETHAFGGTEGMASAHGLFHLDSRYLLAYLTRSWSLISRSASMRHRPTLTGPKPSP
ncbi:MAG: thiopeptide-type bacteriocin biosynthesis protein [Pseudonocardiaceae bacterium]